mmetsp:Transcript_41169/g.106501  ORF Transcript_41169/g.106501 Transcript_41169/m.106501 type:complete len:284 (-) Transcript_41169:529-1380(-)
MPCTQHFRPAMCATESGRPGISLMKASSRIPLTFSRTRVMLPPRGPTIAPWKRAMFGCRMWRRMRSSSNMEGFLAPNLDWYRLMATGPQQNLPMTTSPCPPRPSTHFGSMVVSSSSISHCSFVPSSMRLEMRSRSETSEGVLRRSCVKSAPVLVVLGTERLVAESLLAAAGRAALCPFAVGPLSTRNSACARSVRSSAIVAKRRLSLSSCDLWPAQAPITLPTKTAIVYVSLPPGNLKLKKAKHITKDTSTQTRMNHRMESARCVVVMMQRSARAVTDSRYML